jgi:UDP-2,4-diacetamido-2,4,6-trideoxy-beta-L-altropyranose hydrolase
VIIFRINASSTVGIGHLARCRRLAVRLKKDGYIIKFVLDYINDYLSNYLQGFSCYGIYSENELFSSEKEDATRFLQYCNINKVSAVIVDDYRLSLIWEREITKLKYPVVVIDDQNKNKHQCNLLIDSTWEGKRTPYRYQGIVADDTICLLGPKYLLIDEEFGDQTIRQKILAQKKKRIRLLFSLGGGGDLLLWVSILLKLIENQPDEVQYQLVVVVGPYATNKEQLLEIANKNHEIEILNNQDGLIEQLKKTDIYIGASGGTLFEALALRIPSLTFSISENQQNENENFEDIGHYFHFNSLGEDDFDDFVKLLWEVVLQYDRVYKLYQKPTSVQIDGKGVGRVCDAIRSTILGNTAAPIDLASEKQNNDMRKGYSLAPIDDSAINRYLFARNLEVNLSKMIEKNRITLLRHYLWWFQKNKRTSYVLKKNGEELLFIWHQLQKVEQNRIIVSGWFVCTEHCSALDAMHAVAQHSLIIDNLFPGSTWIIVIRKDNYFMQKFNQRLGFEKIEKGDSMENMVKICFPMATSNNFLYYFRKIKKLA